MPYQKMFTLKKLEKKKQINKVNQKINNNKLIITNKLIKKRIKSAGASIPVGGVGSRRRGVVGLVRSLREQARRKPPLPPQGLLLNPLSPLPPSTNNSTHA